MAALDYNSHYTSNHVVMWIDINKSVMSDKNLNRTLAGVPAEEKKVLNRNTCAF